LSSARRVARPIAMVVVSDLSLEHALRDYMDQVHLTVSLAVAGLETPGSLSEVSAPQPLTVSVSFLCACVSVLCSCACILCTYVTLESESSFVSRPQCTPAHTRMRACTHNDARGLEAQTATR